MSKIKAYSSNISTISDNFLLLTHKFLIRSYKYRLIENVNKFCRFLSIGILIIILLLLEDFTTVNRSTRTKYKQQNRAAKLTKVRGSDADEQWVSWFESI